VIQLPVSQSAQPPFDRADDLLGIRNEVYRLVIARLIWLGRIDNSFARFSSLQYSFKWQENISKFVERNSRTLAIPFEKWFDVGGLSTLDRHILKAIRTAAQSDDLKGEVKVPFKYHGSQVLSRPASGFKGRLGFRFQCTLTLMEAVGQSQEVVKGKISVDKEWSSDLSMKDALRVLEKHKDEIPDAILPAVSSLVLQVKSVTSKELDLSSPLVQLKKISNSETAELKSSLKQINSLLVEISEQKIKSHADLLDYVTGIREIIRRGPFDLLLAAKIQNMEAGTKVALTFEKSNTKYPAGRLVVYPLGQSEASKRRITFFPLRIASPVE
jgi:hypothetical protein